MKILLTVFRKELTDGIRDRRSMISALIMPLLFPLMITFMLNQKADQNREAFEIDIPVVGSERAPDLIDWFVRQGYDVIDGPEDAETAVRDEVHNFVLVISDEFVERFAQGRRADVELIYDGSRTETSRGVQRVRNLIREYGRMVGSLRLTARGLSPSLGTPVGIDDIDIVSARERSAERFNFIPLIVIMATFLGGMNIAIDATAGERERSSLEALLVNPVSRRTLVLGKWLAASTFASASIGLTLASLLVALSRVPLQQLGIELYIGEREIVGVMLVTLPLALFASGLQVMFATFARSYKEAQTYLSMLVILPMVPHLVVSSSSLGEAWWMFLVPCLGQQLMIADVLGGETINTAYLLMVILVSPMLGLLCVEITSRLFNRERIVFGR